MENDAINPSHYKGGFAFREMECIDLTRELPFSIGNAVKYVWRAGMKDDAEQDLAKAEWYIQDERFSPKMTRQNRENAFIVLNLVSMTPHPDFWHLKYSIIFHLLNGQLTEARQLIGRLKKELKK